MEPQKFTIRGRLKSFVYAIAGIRTFIRQEHNARVHLVATILVTAAAIGFRVTTLEAVALTITISIVWITELLNTAIERLADSITLEIDPRIKFIKDIAAGAVLIASIAAVVIGLIIFIPKIL